MAGSQRERAPGVWELRADVGTDPRTGRRVQVSRTFRGTGKRARADAMRDLLAEADRRRAALAEPPDPDQVTVGELLERWQRLREAEWSPKTAHDHAGTVDRWILPRLGTVAVTDLRRSTVSDFYADIAARGSATRGPLSASTVRKVHTVLHAALEDAVELELIAANPATKARRPKVDQFEADVPSLDQVRRVVALAGEKDPMMATVIRLAIATGARRGELVALRWSDVDLDRATVHIQRAAVKLPGQPVRVKSTKTGATGVLAIDPGTVDALRAWRRRSNEISLALGRGRIRESDWLFSDDELDGPRNPDHISGRWQALRRNAGIPGVRLHDLRHACATHMIAAGIDVRTVAGRLRHSSPAMTLDVYAARDLNADRAAAAKWGQLLDG